MRASTHRFAVLEGFAGMGVDAAKPGTSHAAANTVVGTALPRFEEIATRIAHEAMVAQRLRWNGQRLTEAAVGLFLRTC